MNDWEVIPNNNVRQYAKTNVREFIEYGQTFASGYWIDSGFLSENIVLAQPMRNTSLGTIS